MKEDRRNRGLRVIAWLLMPFAVWAASFVGGWIGAVVQNGGSENGSTPLWLAAGGIIGGLLGLAACLAVIRFLRRPPPGDS